MNLRIILSALLVIAPISGVPGQTPEAARLPSPGKAQTLSIISTLAPMAAGGILLAAGDEGDVSAIVIGTGAVLGPAIGYFYGGSAGRGVGGILIRSAASFVGLLGYCLLVCDDDGIEGGTAMMVAGGAVMAGSIAFDLFTVKSTIAGRNARKQSRTTVSAAPTHFRDGRSGLVLRVEF